MCALGGTELDFKVLRDGDRGAQKTKPGLQARTSTSETITRSHRAGPLLCGEIKGKRDLGRESVGGLSSEHSREKMKNPLWRTPNHEFVLSRIWSKKNSY